MAGIMRLIASTFSLEEAKQIADRFEAQGYKTRIIENKRGSVVLYEVWGGIAGEGFEIKGERRLPLAKETKTD
jgi:hypothetical protein